MWKYLVVFLTDGDVQGTNQEDIAYSYVGNPDCLVVDTKSPVETIDESVLLMLDGEQNVSELDIMEVTQPGPNVLDNEDDPDPVDDPNDSRN